MRSARSSAHPPLLCPLHGAPGIATGKGRPHGPPNPGKQSGARLESPQGQGLVKAWAACGTNPRADGSEVPHRPPGHSRQGGPPPPTPPTQVPQRRACSCPGAATWEGFGTPELLGLDLPHVLVETCLCKLSSVLSELRARLGCWQSWAGECPSKSVTSAAAGGARGGRSVAGRATSRSSGLSGGPRLPRPPAPQQEEES